MTRNTAPSPNTKTGRAAIARQARRHGYFHDRDNFTIAVACPLGRERASGAQPGHGQSVIQALDALMDDHLLHDCSKGPQQ
ncbi:hypothetical protein E1286_46085 [Nonomuraea terrae]|uniref:Uncharacterized protein n=1 Tax=Nonomuraea terrae TaxID=2530383 RepID=A0A4R4XH86_9ACTN|nr:hypothetical protein [Nonomuraea terrae]TDD30186.1 hypothetical protein E1286_46085 [Nonomuraea terrae]